MVTGRGIIFICSAVLLVTYNRTVLNISKMRVDMLTKISKRLLAVISKEELLSFSPFNVGVNTDRKDVNN